MSRKEIVILCILLGVLVGMNAYHLARRESAKGRIRLLVEHGTITISINAATRSELEELPGIGPVLADRILRYRAENDGFRAIEDLQEVKGIGPALYKRICSYLRL